MMNYRVCQANSRFVKTFARNTSMNVNFTDTSQTDMSCTKFIINSQLMICTFYSTVKKKPEHVAK